MKLDETGADGLVPISALGREYFRYDPDAQTLTGERSRRVIGLGQRVAVRLAEAAPITGGLLFELLEVEGRGLPTPPRSRRQGRAAAQARAAPHPAGARDRARPPPLTTAAAHGFVIAPAPTAPYAWSAPDREQEHPEETHHEP